MRTPLTSVVVRLLPLAAAFILSAPAGTAAAATGKVLIGVAPLNAQLGQGNGATDVGDAVRQLLVSDLGGPVADVVPLESRIPQQLDAEVQQRHCTYVLYTSVTQKHSMSLGGLLHAMAPVAAALPMLGGGSSGGAMAGAAASAVTQGAMVASQQEAMAAMSGAQKTNIKSGDTLTLEYRLLAPGQAAPVKEGKLQGKASSDGQDILSPLVQQVASTVVGAATGQPMPPGGAPTPNAHSDAAGAGHSGTGKTSFLGGLFGGHGASAGNAPADNPSPPPNIDCDKMAAMPMATMSADSCRKMMASQQAYAAAANDPSARRPGDEQMSCNQIMAELREQQYQAPDQAKLKEAQAAAREHQAVMSKQQAEIKATAAVQQAQVNAALAADKATEAASGGLVQGRAATATEQAQMAQNRVRGEQMARERQPAEQHLTASTASLATDAGTQVTANPRLARLIQLANEKGCQGGQ